MQTAELDDFAKIMLGFGDGVGVEVEHRPMVEVRVGDVQAVTSP